MWPPQEEIVAVVILQLLVLKKALHALRILDVDILSQDFRIGSVSLVFPISQMQQDVGGNLLREQVESLTSILGQTARQAILNSMDGFIEQLKKSDLKIVEWSHLIHAAGNEGAAEGCVVQLWTVESPEHVQVVFRGQLERHWTAALMADDLVPIDQSFFGDEELSLVKCHYGLVVVWSVVAQIPYAFFGNFLFATDPFTITYFETHLA